MIERASALAGKVVVVALLPAATFLVGACTGTSTAGSTAGSTSSATSATAASAASSATATSPALATRVPPPKPGSIHQTVATRAPHSAAPLPFTSTAKPNRDIAVSLVRAVSTRATGRLPGEVSGPAVSVTVRVHDGSARSIPLSSVTVTVMDASGASWTNIESAASPLPRSVASGASADGTYVFHRPANATGPITISINYSASTPTIVFVGRAG